MNVYLTGVNVTKSLKKNSSKKVIKPQKEKILKESINKLKEDTNVANEGDISSDQVKVSFVTSKEATNKTNQILSSKEENNDLNSNKINSNNFISNEDKNKNNKFLTERDFSKMRINEYKKKKNNELISNEIKNEYVEYIMFKEPKYADFDKISEEYQKQLYSSYQKYNNNLLVIKRKKEELKLIISIIEKSRK